MAVLGYWIMGYAFHLGGAHALNPGNAALAGLDMIFAPSGWGIIGLRGFALSGDDVTPTVLSLFLIYLPLVAAAVLLVMLSLVEVRLWVAGLAGALLGTVVLPVAACWVWGGGWLATLGQNISLAHGFVDFGGSSLVLWLPGTIALGVLLMQPRNAPESPPHAPPAHFPALANVGALLLGIGWLGWALSEPFHTYGTTLDWNRTAISTLLGMAGAVLTSQLYTWLVTGNLEPLMAARGLAAGWGALLASAPFLAPWAAMVVGLLTGILFPLVLYALETTFLGGSNGRWRNAAATVALGVTGGLGGVLSVGLFADGRWGFGWNGIGAADSLQPLGVTGIIAGNLEQITAQLAGLLAIGIWGVIFGSVLGLIVRLSMAKKSEDKSKVTVKRPVTSALAKIFSQVNIEKAEEKARPLERTETLATIDQADQVGSAKAFDPLDIERASDTDNGGERAQDNVELVNEMEGV
jgi:Amt family ammonium transporter